MANFDGTGPRGMGPMTGRGMGPCSPFGFGMGWRGRGMRRGLGRFYGNNAWPTDKKEQLKMIQDYRKALEEELEDLKKEEENLSK